MKIIKLVANATLFSALIGLTACQSVETSSKTVETSSKTVETLNWVGSYQGNLPCADCDAIQTQISLFENGLFSKTELYLGKENEKFTESGDIAWDKDNAIVTLSSNNVDTKFKVVKDALIMLGFDGKPAEGELADRYTLQKQATTEPVTQ